MYCLLYALTGALVGTAARVILPDLATPDNAFARIATEALPIGITGLVLAAALAAVMSTASAGLLASSTILANDVYAGFIARGDHNKVLVSRVTTLLVGVGHARDLDRGERRGGRPDGRLRPPDRRAVRADRRGPVLEARDRGGGAGLHGRGQRRRGALHGQRTGCSRTRP